MCTWRTMISNSFLINVELQVLTFLPSKLLMRESNPRRTRWKPKRFWKTRLWFMAASSTVLSLKEILLFNRNLKAIMMKLNHKTSTKRRSSTGDSSLFWRVISRTRIWYWSATSLRAPSFSNIPNKVLQARCSYKSKIVTCRAVVCKTHSSVRANSRTSHISQASRSTLNMVSITDKLQVGICVWSPQTCFRERAT